MKVIKIIYSKLLAPSCLYTVIICALLLLIASASNSMLPAVKASVFGSIFGYCFFFSATNLIFSIKKLNIVLKYLIHFIINTAIFVLIPGYVAESNTGTPRIYYAIVYIGLYAIVAVIAGVISHFTNKKAPQKEKDYKKQF